MITAEQVRQRREDRETAAARIAADIPPGDYHAYNNTVVNSDTRETVTTVATHWDACLIMMRIAKKIMLDHRNDHR